MANVTGPIRKRDSMDTKLLRPPAGESEKHSWSKRGPRRSRPVSSFIGVAFGFEAFFSLAMRLTSPLRVSSAPFAHFVLEQMPKEISEMVAVPRVSGKARRQANSPRAWLADATQPETPRHASPFPSDSFRIAWEAARAPRPFGIFFWHLL